MEQVLIESLYPAEMSEAASVLARAMCPSPIHMAVFKWQHEKERDLQEAFFKAALGRLLEGTLVAKQGSKIVGVVWLHPLPPLPDDSFRSSAAFVSSTKRVW